MIDKKTVLVIVAAVAFGWWLAGSHPAPTPGPFGPSPQPRPVLTLIGRLAKLGLWVMLCAEKPPEEKCYVVRSTFDEDGHPNLNNARGW